MVTAVDTAGNTVTTSAENLGGTTNQDGTVSFKTESGEMKTLPMTGEKRAWWSYLVGFVVILGAIYLGAKDKINGFLDKFREDDEEEDEE